MEETRERRKVASPAAKRRFRRTLFVWISSGWFLLDATTKVLCNTGCMPGQVIDGDFIPGILRLRLVHNTGAAWGLFDDATAVLGIFSVLVCMAVFVYLSHLRRWQVNPAELIGLALVMAGGLGNAIDRLTRGYVVDMFEPTFIDFPTFNVADIGVTCGLVLFFIGYIFVVLHPPTPAFDAAGVPTDIAEFDAEGEDGETESTGEDGR